MITQLELKEILHYDPSNGLFTWKVTKARSTKVGMVAGTKEDRYNVIKIDGKMHTAHRLAFLYMTGSFPKDCVDHINMAKHDNRWCNLRNATRSQNKQNVGIVKTNKLGIKGVHRAFGKYKASATTHGKAIYLGLHDTPEQASQVYQDFAKRNHGEFYVEAR